MPPQASRPASHSLHPVGGLRPSWILVSEGGGSLGQYLGTAYHNHAAGQLVLRCHPASGERRSPSRALPRDNYTAPSGRR